MKVYYLLFGSEATPADNPFLWRVRRCTAAGTSTAVVPTILDPGDLVTEQDAGENHTVEPTYTSATELLVVPLHQRATFQWSAAPGREIVTPATASNGLGVETPTSAAVVIAASLQFEV